MSNRDGEAGMETMLWDISVIPNEQDKRCSTYECVGPLRTFHPFFTSRLTFQTLAVSLFFCVGVLGLGWLLLVVFLFPVLQVFWNPEFSAHFRHR